MNGQGPPENQEPFDANALLQTAIDGLHEKIKLQGEIITSQRQTIDSQREMIEAHRKQIADMEKRMSGQ